MNIVRTMKIYKYTTSIKIDKINIVSINLQTIKNNQKLDK